MTDEEWRANVLRRMSALEDEITKLTTRLFHVESQHAVDEVHRKNVETRLSGIEEALRRLVLIIVSAMLLGVIGFVFNGGMAP